MDLGSILHRRGHRLVIALGFVPGLLSCHCQGFYVSSKTCSQVPLPPRMCPMLDGGGMESTMGDHHSWHHDELLLSS